MDDAAELLRRLAAVITPAVSGITVGKLYITYKMSRTRGRAWQLERNLLRPFVVAHWRRPAASLGPQDWIKHRAHRRKTKTRLGRFPCELTLNLELSRAKQMLGWGVDEGKLPAHPFRTCKRVKTRIRRESWFNDEQIARLLAAGYELRWRHQQLAFRAIVAAMACTGLRISEALSLRWDRITLRGVTSVLGKGAKTRVIAFTPEALREMNMLDRHQWNPLVFVNWRTNKVYNASTVRAWFRQAIELARLEGVKADGDLALVPHILRHSFASIADERGARSEWIQNALGHSEASTTRVYLHRSEANAAIRMARIMSTRKPPRKSPTQRSPSVDALEVRSRIKFS